MNLVERSALMQALAEKIWPNRKPTIHWHPDALPAPSAWVEVDGVLMLGIDHANALEALHATLVIMACDGSEPALFDSGRRFQHASDWYSWQEQLVRDLELVHRSMVPGVASVPLRACIDTLRERGKGSHL